MKPTFQLLLLVAVLTARGIFAAEVKTTVKYASVSAVYINAGRAQGIQIGDRVEVHRSEKLIAVLQVQFVADHSSACRLLKSPGTIEIGDEAVVLTSGESENRTGIGDVKEINPSPSQTPSLKKQTSRVNRVKGRASIGAMIQNGEESGKFDIIEPSLSLRMQIENLFDTRHTLSVRVRGRRIERSENAPTDLRSGWNGHVYEVAVSYDNPQSAYRYSVGRILNSRLRGIGYFDGLAFERRMSSGFRVGLFGGTRPDATTTEPTTDHAEYGLFGSYESGVQSTNHWQATLAAAGQYQSGKIDREFMYEQISYSYGKAVAFYHSAEMNINRDWLKQAGASRLEIVNVQVSAKYMPSQSVTTTLSYDTRSNYRTLETRSTPDSLFDHARQQGMQLGAQWRVLPNVRIGASGGLRLSNANRADTRSYSTNLTFDNVPVRGASISIAAMGFVNSFTRGLQPSIAISHTILPSLSAGAQAGVNRYEYRQQSESMQNAWLRIRSDANFSRALYGSAYYEIYRGDSPALTRIFFETGVRF